MCGILCEICYADCKLSKEEALLRRILNRGPDYFQNFEKKITDEVSIYFCGSVLWMQGAAPTKQPVENEHGVLLYNGDIFDKSWDKNISDTSIIMTMLTDTIKWTDYEIIKKIKLLKGPLSLIFYNKLTSDIYFTRDRIGRNSLLFYRNGKSIVISSVLGRKYDCIEIPATHIYKLNILSKKIQLYSWENNGTEEQSIDDWVNRLLEQQCLADNQLNIDDCLVLSNDENGVIKHIENTSKTKNKLELMRNLLGHSDIEDTVQKLTKLLEKSVKIRIKKQPNKCKECLSIHVHTCTHSSVGILFSGGLDCTILAFLADKYVSKEQSIDLINVAFKKENNTTYDVPDRLTGKQSLEELKQLCKTRKWVFKEVNVSYEKLRDIQKSKIADLVHPRKTILDESLGSALWFAAQGQDDTDVSPCRVLLLGSGADELFGGYSRHRNAYKRHGWLGLSKELQLDWKRISFRNLARDNRVISDHGRQPRMPYLDEDVTEFVLQLPPWLKCFPNETLGIGLGDKLMLRLVAFNLGFTEVALFPKRALQFGSRIANKKEKGSDISKTFTDLLLNDIV